MTTRDTIGWIGTGKMGLPMAGHLIDAGHTVRVAEPDAANRAAAVARGAQSAENPADLARTCRTVFVMIPDDAVLKAVVFGPDGLAGSMRSGQTLIEMSTVSPQISREVAAALQPAGISYLRAPVSGSTATASSAKLTVLASGPRAAFDAAEPLLSTFSARRFHVGEGEEARYLKLVLNSLVGATAALAAEALEIGRAGGLSVADMTAVIAESAVASPLLAYKRTMLESGDFSPAFTVRQMNKDFDLILAAAAEGELHLSVLPLVKEKYERAIAEGKGGSDFFVLAERAIGKNA